MNFLKPSETAGFIDTGYWAHKAMEYAACYGQVITIGSSADQGYHIIPEISAIQQQLAYVQLTTNNTIYGTQYRELPKIAVPLIADMSSDLLSRPRDFSAIDFAFACAQKNVGPAGVSVAIVKRTFLEKAHPALPPIFSYKNLVAHHSNYATPPVVNVYMSLLNLRWLKAAGGVEGIQKVNEEKAALLYAEIERNSLFYSPVTREHRSHMNCCFFAKEKNTELAFVEFCKEKNIIGIEGHKEAGGLRASIYNAQSLENVAYLVSVMQQFELQHA
jgi:phosphoserine aminotransferase